MNLTSNQLQQILGRTPPNLQAFTTAFNDGFPRFEITTPQRVCHFLAQVAHETGGLRWLRELGDQAYFTQYENRRDLGNTQPGDGYRYRGAGLLHTTGRYNFALISTSLGIDFLNQPDRLAELPHCVTAGLWEWQRRKLNQWADVDDVQTITRRINGGLNGLRDRLSYLQRAKLVLGIEMADRC